MPVMVAEQMTFAERLKQIREQAGLSQYRLAQLSGLSKQTISVLERGGYEPSWDTVRRLAQALGVPVGEFDTGEPLIPNPSAEPADQPEAPRPMGKRK